MLKIRLMRIGTKKKPFYRVVAVDERNKRTGGYIELLGTYNPLTEPKDIKLKQDRIDYWIKQGAQMSDGYLRMVGKAPQRPPRKPKKEKVSKEAEVSKVSEVTEEKKEEAPAQPAGEEPKTEEKASEEKPEEEKLEVGSEKMDNEVRSENQDQENQEIPPQNPTSHVT
ncbi:30S ribosomal protein S16, partial [Candidatus Daviesbacteria bacterium]|nr:30S ribosomal protein S16 [Candidatus Daviesbacteria bacterium]